MRRACVLPLAFVGLAGLAVQLVAVPANANAPEQAADLGQSSARTAEITIAASDDEATLLRAGVTEQLERLGVHADTRRRERIDPGDVVAATSAGPEPVLARVWLDFSTPSEAVLYVADGAGERVLVRRFVREGRNEIAREATMAAMQSAVDALLHGSPIGVSREEARVALGLPVPAEAPASPPREAQKSPPPCAKVTIPPSPPKPATTIGIGVLYEAAVYDSGSVAHGPLARVSVTRSLGRRSIGLTLSGQYRFPISATSAPVTLRVESGALRMAGFVGLLRREPFELRATVGGGVDLTRGDPRLTNSADATLTPISRVDGVVRAGFVGRGPLLVLPNANFELELAVEILPSARPWAVARGDTQTALLSPWTVRPVLAVGLTVP